MPAFTGTGSNQLPSEETTVGETTQDESPPSIPDTPKTPADEKGYVTSTVDSTKVPLANLLTNISGQNWTVDYFSQILGRDDAPRSIDLTLSPTLQQYHNIKDLNIKVQTPLDYEFLKERQGNRLIGTAIVLPGTVVPTRGDCFIADKGNGQGGLFVITDVTPLTHLMDRCYEISYSSTGSYDEKVANLLEKTVKTSHYVEDFLIHGQNPVISSETLVTKTELNNMGYYLVSTYSEEFVAQNPQRTLMMPEQEEATHDIFLCEYIGRLVDTSQYPALRGANWYSIPETSGVSKRTIWDLLIDLKPLDVSMLGSLTATMLKPVNIWAFKTHPWFTGIYYSRVKKLIWFTDDDKTLDQLQRTEDTSTLSDTGDIFPVNIDDFYVLSEAFYKGNRENCSLLERMTLDMLSRKSISSKDLLRLCQLSFKWPELERFYYTPILISLVQYVTRRI